MTTRRVIGLLLLLLSAAHLARANEPSGAPGQFLTRLFRKKTEAKKNSAASAPARRKTPSTTASQRVPNTRLRLPPANNNAGGILKAEFLTSAPSIVHRQAHPSGQAIAPPPDQPLTLDVLERLALDNNPTLVQAQTAVDAARGRRVQAGLYPNPNIGYVGSEIGNEGRAGQQGMSGSQEIVRSGKLRLSQAVAAHEVEQAQARAEAQRLRVLSSVRAAFYHTLAAERTLSYYVAVVSIRDREQRFPWLKKPAGLDEKQPPLVEKTLSDAKEMRDKGEIADAKVLPIELEVEQLRIRAENAAADYAANWKRLTALVGLPDLKLSPLLGDLETGIANLTSDESLTRILSTSPEVRVADAGVRRAEDAARRARVQPVPNITIEAGTQYDYASRDTIVGLGLSLPLPIYNRNQGNILAADAELLRAMREVDRVRLALSERFAGVFGRYDKAHEQVAGYRALLPKARRSYEQTILSYRQLQANPSDLILVQRALVDYNVAYIQALAELHASTIEINGLLLTDGLGEAPGPVDGVGGARD